MKITVIGPTFDASGYAAALRSFTLGLHNLGYRVRIISRDWNQLEAQLDVSMKEQLRKLCSNKILSEGPIIHFTIPENFDPISGRKNIGITMLECDRIPDYWVEQCNRMNQIWVPSTFNKRTFEVSGVTGNKIEILPIGVDSERFHPNVPPMDFKIKNGGFVFLSNFEWIPRKGYETLLSAYLSEFSSSDSVTLIIKTYNGSQYDPSGKAMHDTWKRMIKKFKKKNPPSLKFITQGLPDDQMPSFYTSGHCYIIPSYGEGWNLPALEAMSSGVPVITTNWSAHLDFVNNQNGFLIPVNKLIDIPKYGIPNDRIYQGAKWAEPSKEYTAMLMRFAYEHREIIKQKGELARQAVIREWDNSKIMKKAEKLLRGLEE